MLHKNGFAESFVGVAKIGVKSLAAVVVVVPSHGVIVAHFAVFVRFFVNFYQDVYFFVEILEIIKLIFYFPTVGKPKHGSMVFIDGHGLARLHVGVARVAHKLRARQFVIPRPIILGVGGGVNAHVAAARLNVSLKGHLLRVVQHVARGA